MTPFSAFLHLFPPASLHPPHVCRINNKWCERPGCDGLCASQGHLGRNRQCCRSGSRTAKATRRNVVLTVPCINCELARTWASLHSCSSKLHVSLLSEARVSMTCSVAISQTPTGWRASYSMFIWLLLPSRCLMSYWAKCPRAGHSTDAVLLQIEARGEAASVQLSQSIIQTIALLLNQSNRNSLFLWEEERLPSALFPKQWQPNLQLCLGGNADQTSTSQRFNNVENITEMQVSLT